MNSVYALFPDAESAHRAYNALRAASDDLGFDRRRIVVSSSEPIEEYVFEDEKPNTPMFALAAMGGLFGGVCGYLLTSLTQRSYPLPTGAMPITPWWTNGIIIYELTMLGAILTTLVSLLIGAHLPNFKAHLSDPRIWAGKILVGVADPPAGSRVELEKRLRQAGAAEVNVTPES